MFKQENINKLTQQGVHVLKYKNETIRRNMLKLKYLFANLDLATMMVNNFENDDLEIMQYYMISANAVYPFRNKGEVKFLRLAPSEARNYEQIKTEIDILSYLEKKNFPAMRAVTALNGDYIIKKDTPFGEYFATVFDRVPGECAGEIEMNDSLAKKIGESLAKLHNTLATYQSKRESFNNKFDWIENELTILNDDVVLKKLHILKKDFEKIELTEDNFGLIHYDYELDNVFYDKDSDTIYPIDFDDSIYHLYTMDLVQTLDSFEENKEIFGESFMNGYKSFRSISKNYDEEAKLCRRFANLYSYTRISRSDKEIWENEPEWLTTLRIKFTNAKKSKLDLM